MSSDMKGSYAARAFKVVWVLFICISGTCRDDLNHYSYQTVADKSDAHLLKETGDFDFGIAGLTPDGIHWALLEYKTSGDQPFTRFFFRTSSIATQPGNFLLFNKAEFPSPDDFMPDFFQRPCFQNIWPTSTAVYDLHHDRCKQFEVKHTLTHLTGNPGICRQFARTIQVITTERRLLYLEVSPLGLELQFDEPDLTSNKKMSSLKFNSGNTRKPTTQWLLKQIQFGLQTSRAISKDAPGLYNGNQEIRLDLREWTPGNYVVILGVTILFLIGALIIFRFQVFFRERAESKIRMDNMIK